MFCDIQNSPNKETTEVQLREPMSYIGVTYRSMGEGLFPGEETEKASSKA